MTSQREQAYLETKANQQRDSMRKADGEHQEDPEREYGKRMRTEEDKRKTVEEQEESLSRDTVRYLKTLERDKTEKESEGTQEAGELVEVEVNQEKVEWESEGETQFEDEGGR